MLRDYAVGEAAMGKGTAALWLRGVEMSLDAGQAGGPSHFRSERVAFIVVSWVLSEKCIHSSDRQQIWEKRGATSSTA